MLPSSPLLVRTVCSQWDFPISLRAGLTPRSPSTISLGSCSGSRFLAVNPLLLADGSFRYAISFDNGMLVVCKEQIQPSDSFDILEVSFIKYPGPIYTMQWSPDGTWLAAITIQTDNRDKILYIMKYPYNEEDPKGELGFNPPRPIENLFAAKFYLRTYPFRVDPDTPNIQCIFSSDSQELTLISYDGIAISFGLQSDNSWQAVTAITRKRTPDAQILCYSRSLCMYYEASQQSQHFSCLTAQLVNGQDFPDTEILFMPCREIYSAEFSPSGQYFVMHVQYTAARRLLLYRIEFNRFIKVHDFRIDPSENYWQMNTKLKNFMCWSPDDRQLAIPTPAGNMSFFEIAENRITLLGTCTRKDVSLSGELLKEQELRSMQWLVNQKVVLLSGFGLTIFNLTP